MRRIFAPVFIVCLLLSGCGSTPSLWGQYATPTADLTVPTSLDPWRQPELPSATPPAPPPTPSFTASPTLIPSQSSTPLSGGGASFGIPPLESSLTPTFDVPASTYYAQSGDTLPSLAARFGVEVSEIRSDAQLPDPGLVPPATLLVLPNRLSETATPNIQIMPDSEVVFSATAADFNIASYIESANGKLHNYSEYLGSTGWTSGTDEIIRLAYENSVNPRLLLALLDYEARWVHGQPVDSFHTDYPMGYYNVFYKGMFSQMVWAVNQLSIAYYGWRTGTLTGLDFPDGTHLRLDPRLNAGTAAVQYLFSKMHSQSQWAQMIDPESGFPAMYSQMFGDPWARADTVEPLFPAGLVQPSLSLPFQPKTDWSLTGGPHGAWEHDGSLAAIDFAPATDHGGCDQTPTWVTAAAPGLIVRSERGVVIEDLDGDGYEQTGWDLVYLHIAGDGRVAVGTYVQRNDRIGHASCEGGVATGTHLHFARKYNGEWVAADGPLPMMLDGWTVHQGQVPYEGTLTRDNSVVVADPVGQLKSVIVRSTNDP